MPLPIRSAFRRQQPRLVLGINHRNPITNGLIFAVNGHCSYDVARQLVPDINTNLLSTTSEGECLNFDGTFTKRHQYYTSPIDNGDLTLFSFARGNAFDGALIGAHCIGATRNNSYLAIDVDGTYIAVSRQDLVYSLARGAMYSAGTFQKVLGTFTTAQRTIRVDNNPEVVDVAGLNPSGMNTFILGGWINNTDTFASGLNGDIRTGLAWNRILTSQEQDSIMDNPDQVFITVPDYNLPFHPSAQFSRPSGVVSAGSWLASPSGTLASVVDEQVPNFTDYMYTVDAGICEINTGAVTNPVSVVNNKVKHWVQADNGAIKVSLMQGTTVIASWIYDPAPSVWTLKVQTLTAGEAGSITDYATLTYKIEAY